LCLRSAIATDEDPGVASMNLIAKIHAALERHYGSKKARRAPSNPLDGLILAILSQKTRKTHTPMRDDRLPSNLCPSAR
jgi:endonuclease III